ncbi:MAG: ATP-dependent zinc metalloprotease FtsH [Candidatus Omnitrophica bacterium]|nr:ATP-dependent zinc metalloprotease FtsH [Candidatus Omnitrophota bacterium]MDD5310608.1 ATP-dependent zinc metalloprotease FtsH [Candidatus Omnitrophota bacterium]MDD5545612.1 ATP-dependent zinc metalloprotease FtsH [Candidatus Omnitrophota bacterium]
MANGNKKKKKNNQVFFITQRLVMALLFVVILMYVFREPMNLQQQSEEISLSDFTKLLVAKKVATAVKKDYSITGKLVGEKPYKVFVPDFYPELNTLLTQNTDFKVSVNNAFLANFFWTFVPVLLLIGFWLYLSRNAQAAGGRIWSFGKSRARQFAGGAVKITFQDVAGVDEAKEELQEVIEFLKDPRKFTRLGGKIPKGVLLIGPPGTGKTLLAKAVAGEADVPFFSISGSDFVEMFVGVGASRVRDLFEEAKRAAKLGGKGCIIFVDEIDAVGRQRFAGVGGGNDEREQTLNALLVEMDGFGTQEGVIVIAATNRPDVLDSALLRPGRFDRVIYVTEPDIIGREAILKVHAKNVKLAPEVDLKLVAQRTVGFSGADLANLVNEAALLASRRNKDAVTMEELGESIERVIAGPARKSRVMSAHEKEITAYHESGHALLSLLIAKAEPLHKVTILPRGMAGGYTLTAPSEDRYYKSKNDLFAEITVSLGGRASEEIMFNDVTTGARSDIKVATKIARRMVTEFGMSDKLGNLTLGYRPDQIFLGRDIYEEKNYSDQTALIIDEEVKRIVDECYIRAKQTLIDNKDKLTALATKLLDKEVLDVKEVKELLGI